ncbi:hypothetical protein HDR60_00795 [bacterium]|nr:hypothetical protein [bacterium]
MNKKIITNTLYLSLLIGCVTSTGIPIDEEVLQKNSITYTLDTYDRYLHDFIHRDNNNFDKEYRLLSEKIDEKNPSVNIRAIDCLRGCTGYGASFYDVDYRIYYDNIANSDECIIYRRNNAKIKVRTGAFDYKKFLPENSNVKTDDDFLLLVNKYKEYNEDKDKELKSCYKIYEDNSLTSTEKDEKYTQCETDNENTNNKFEGLLKSYIFEGGLEKDKNKIQSVIADCKQAVEQASKYKENYNKCSENIKGKVDNYKKSIGYNNLKDLSLGSSYKVVDFAKDGVMIKREFNAQEMQLFSFVAAIAGKTPSSEQSYFVYTKDTNYANGDYFRNRGLYYIEDGVYKYTTVTGATNSLQALKPTKYKIIDVKEKIAEIENSCGKSDYKYIDFLKDETIIQCDITDSNYCYKDGNKKKCFEEKDGIIIPDDIMR